MKRFLYVILLFLLHFFIVNQLLADTSNPIPIKNGTENLSILPNIQVLYSASATLTFEQVSSAEFSSRFVPYDKEKNLFPEKNVVWVRFTLQNQSNDDHWLLDLGAQYDSATLYFTDNHQRIRGYTDGSRLLKEYKVKYYGFFSYLPLDIPKNTTQTYYLRLEIYKNITLQNRNTLKPANNLIIQNESTVVSDQEQRKYFGSAFAGIYLIMAFYSFVLFYNLKDTSYLHFGFLLFASCMTTLFPLDTLVGFLGFNKEEESYFYFTLTPLPWLFGLFFTRSYLRLWEYAPFWNKVSWGIFGLIVLYYLLCIFNIWVAIIIIIITISCVIVALVAGIVVVMRGYKPARYFLLANVFYLGGRIISTLAVFYVINSKFLMLNATTIGGVIQVFLFSVGLFYRLQEIQKDLVKEKEERQKLIESQKENLEAEVKERTKEIQQQRRILKEKNEELQSSEEELRQNMEELETNQEVIKSQRNILEKAFGELERKNLRITDSIRYAKRIQNALLPHEDVLATHFEEHFVIFKPKDVVSGDFYWFEKIGNLKFLAVVDCTGHGVPGAFMSIIGNTLLNEIINNKKIYAPHLILEHLHLGIVDTLNQQQNQYMQDGMDIALCCIEPQENEQFIVSFSGAKSPIYYFSGNKLTEIAGDKKSIGQAKSEQQFQQNTFTLSKNDTIYLKTDGMQDIVNMDRARFGSKRFKEILAQVAYLPLESQKEVILTQMTNFQGDSEQRDDILVVGVKL